MIVIFLLLEWLVAFFETQFKHHSFSFYMLAQVCVMTPLGSFEKVINGLRYIGDANHGTWPSVFSTPDLTTSLPSETCTSTDMVSDDMN